MPKIQKGKTMDSLSLETYREYIVARIKSIKEIIDEPLKIEQIIKLHDSLDWCMKELYLIDSGAYNSSE